jgi:hypothetical protein
VLDALPFQAVLASFEPHVALDANDVCAKRLACRRFAAQSDDKVSPPSHPPKTSFFLLGPRGTGKTTWVKQHFAEKMRFDLLDEARYQHSWVKPGRAE